MKKTLLVLIFCLCTFLNAYCADSKIYINETETEIYRDSQLAYTEIGGGINYQKDDGTFDEAIAEIVPSSRQGIDYECYTTYNRVGFKADITDGNYSIFAQLGNTGKILKSKIVGIAYLNIDTKDWQMIATPNSSIAVVNGNSIRYNNVFPDADIEYVIEKAEFKQNWHINQKHLPASPYPNNQTAVVIVTKMDLANYELPKFIDENGTVDFNDLGQETVEGHIKFSKKTFILSEAIDANNDTQKIRKRLIKKNGEYYLLEGIPYNWLDNAQYPVFFDYTTISTDQTNANWASGTYYISANVNMNTSWTVAAGVIIKFGSAVAARCSGSIDFNGTVASPVYVTSFNDDSVGETIAGSSGSPAKGDWDKIWKQYWDNSEPTWDFEYVVAKYGGFFVGITYNSAYYGNYLYLDDCVFFYFDEYAVRHVPNRAPSVSIAVNCQFRSCDAGKYSGTARSCLFVDGQYGMGGAYADPIADNCTFDNLSGTAFITEQTGSDGIATDTIITNCAKSVYAKVGSTAVLNYCMRWNNTTTDTTGVTDNNPVTSADPDYETGTAETGYEGDMDYFLTQSTSGCVDAGSDTAANLSMDALTTSIDETVDSGTVDVGYHYKPANVAAAAAGVIKTLNGLIFSSVKSYNGLAIGSVKSINGAASQ